MTPQRPILIVEDERLIALQISTLLHEMGYPLTAHTRQGSEAVRKARLLNPELIIMDINLPGAMDGIETAYQIQQQQDIPIIFLTALSDGQTVQRASRVEPYAYLVKPFRPYELETAITIARYKYASEKKLKESEERYRRLFEEARDGIAMIALDSGSVLDCNPALLQMLRKERQEVVGQPLSSLHGPGWELAEPLQALIAAQPDMEQAGGIPTGTSARQTESIVHNGHQRQIEIKASLFRLQERPVMQAIFHDITERLQIEESERQARLQAEALRKSMEALVANLGLEDVLKKILIEFGKLLSYDTAAVVMLQDGRLRLGSSYGIEYQDIFQKNCLNPDQPTMKQIMEGASPVILTPEDLSHCGKDWEKIQGDKNLIAIHLQVRGKVMGYLIILNNPANRYDQAHLNLAQTFANQAAIAIENARLYEEERLAAMTDPLTGLYNRRFFYRNAANELERGKRYGHFPALILLDIDHFKRINDVYGHPVGDLALQYVSTLLQDNVRKVDAVVRIGGEEFAILLPNTSLDKACHVAERLRLKVQASQIATGDGQLIQLTLSLGVATPLPAHIDLNDWLRCADQALYQAKEGGRNRVVVWSGISV